MCSPLGWRRNHSAPPPRPVRGVGGRLRRAQGAFPCGELSLAAAPRSQQIGDPTAYRTHASRSPRKHVACPLLSRWRPMGTKCSTLATWPRRNASAHRRSARSPSVKRSSATSARARAPPTSFRVSSGFRRSRSPTTSPTSLARSGRRGSGCASSRPGVSAAASSSESGTDSTGPRPAQFAGVSTSGRRASPSSRPEPDPRNSRWWPGAAASIRV